MMGKIEEEGSAVGTDVHGYTKVIVGKYNSAVCI